MSLIKHDNYDVMFKRGISVGNYRDNSGSRDRVSKSVDSKEESDRVYEYASRLKDLYEQLTREKGISL
jgi:hypothetical protein